MPQPVRSAIRRGLLGGAARRLRARLGLQLAVTLAVAASIVAFTFATAWAIKAASLDVQLTTTLACFVVLGAVWELHAGVAVVLAASQRVRLSPRVALRLALVGAIETGACVAVPVAMLSLSFALDRYVTTDVVSRVIGEIALLALLSPILVHVATRGWLALTTAQLALSGDPIVAALRRSGAALVGLRGTVLAHRALTLPAALWVPWLLVALRPLERLPVAMDGPQLVLLSVLGVPLATMLDAAIECELYERLTARVDAEQTAEVFR